MLMTTFIIFFLFCWYFSLSLRLPHCHHPFLSSSSAIRTMKKILFKILIFPYHVVCRTCSLEHFSPDDRGIWYIPECCRDLLPRLSHRTNRSVCEISPVKFWIADSSLISAEILLHTSWCSPTTDSSQPGAPGSRILNNIYFGN